MTSTLQIQNKWLTICDSDTIHPLVRKDGKTHMDCSSEDCVRSTDTTVDRRTALSVVPTCH
jgi:hypothetical protein